MKDACFLQGQFWRWTMRKGAQQTQLQDLSIEVLGLLCEKWEQDAPHPVHVGC